MKHPPAESADTEEVEVVVRDHLDERRPLLIRDVDFIGPEDTPAGAHSGQRVRTAQQFVRDLRERVGGRAVRPPLHQAHEIVRPLDRQVFDEQRVKQAEHGSGAADAERQRQDRRHRERGPAGEQPGRVAQVLSGALDPCPAPGSAYVRHMRFLGTVDCGGYSALSVMIGSTRAARRAGT